MNDDKYILTDELCEMVDEADALRVIIQKNPAQTHEQRVDIQDLIKKSEKKRRQFWRTVLDSFPELKGKDIQYNPSIGSIEIKKPSNLVLPGGKRR